MWLWPNRYTTGTFLWPLWGLWPQTRCWKACTSVTNHFYFFLFFFFSFPRVHLLGGHCSVHSFHVCVQVDSPCESSLSWEIKCEFLCFHTVVLFFFLALLPLSQLRARLYRPTEDFLHHHFQRCSTNFAAVFFCDLFSILWDKTFETAINSWYSFLFLRCHQRYCELCKFYLWYSPRSFHNSQGVLSNASLKMTSHPCPFHVSGGICVSYQFCIAAPCYIGLRKKKISDLLKKNKKFNCTKFFKKIPEQYL